MKAQYQYLLWMLLAAVAMWLAWPPLSLTPLIFIGFVPLLYVTDQLVKAEGGKPGLTYIKYVYAGLLLWNIFTTYWVCNATFVGGLIAMGANALLMTIPFYLFFKFMRIGFSRWMAYTALVAFWMALEFLHLNWQLAWPWLNLGNAFAAVPDYVQWYEYTGAFGGTLWVWLVNLGIYEIIRSAIDDRPRLPRVIYVILIAFLPIGWSLFITSPNAPEYKINTAVIQPNVDPYGEKFEVSAEEQIARFIEQSERVADSAELVIWPETAIPNSVNEGDPMSSKGFDQIEDFLEAHPHVTLLSGLNSYQQYPDKATPTARPFQNADAYYDVFNAAMLLDTGYNPQFYHKSILVPGVERMPYPAIFGFLESLAINMGGTSGSLGSQDEASLVKSRDSIRIAPVICYESVFGDYVGDFVNKGADIIAVITNDGWWGNTAGYRQHFQYSRLRAIEFRRAIARSANTGISGFITPDGSTHQITDYWVKATETFELPVYKGQTFYARHGDYIAIAAMIISGGVLLLYFIVWIGKRKGYA